MKWPFALILVGLTVAGCKSQAPVSDPFFGRTTIPPPPTGSATGRPGEPCYQPPPLAPASPQAPLGVAPPLVQMPSQPTSQSQPAQAPAAAQPFASQQTAPATTVRPTTPPGFAPNGLAPRPPSTLPGGAAAASRPFSTTPATPAPGPGSRYQPSGGSFNYRGASTQRAAPLAPAQSSSPAPTTSFTRAGTTRPTTAADDHMPRPVDDSAGSRADARARATPPSSTWVDTGVSGQRPIVQTIQPRVSAAPSRPPVDMADLPMAQ